MALVQISRAYSLSSKRIEYREGSVAYTIFTKFIYFETRTRERRRQYHISHHIWIHIFLFISRKCVDPCRLRAVILIYVDHKNCDYISWINRWWYCSTWKRSTRKVRNFGRKLYVSRKMQMGTTEGKRLHFAFSSIILLILSHRHLAPLHFFRPLSLRCSSLPLFTSATVCWYFSLVFSVLFLHKVLFESACHQEKFINL